MKPAEEDFKRQREIKRRIFSQDDEKFVSRRDGNIECVFNIKPFDVNFFAYVVIKSASGKTKIELFGNSLHGLGSVSYTVLLERINSYHSLSQVMSDFGISTYDVKRN